jgi:peptidoglycan hydrolase CwlO-like protein
MTPEFWIQLCSLILAGAGALGTVYGVLNGRMSKIAAKLHDRIDKAEAQTAEVKQNYVRRDDLHDDIKNLKDDIARVERGQENIAGKVDQLQTNLIPALSRLAEAAMHTGAKQ